MAPYEDYSSVEEARKEAIEKEIQAAITESSCADLRFEAIFSRNRSDRYLRPFHNIPLNPEVFGDLHRCFRISAKSLHGQIIYPRVSKKSIGITAKEECNEILKSHLGPHHSMSCVESILDVERYYHETGVELPGPVEMRSAWKYNDLKPRVYYAQGPSVYHSSKFIQPIFNMILDHFPVVHRQNRYSLPDDQTLAIQDILLIYDYASFTSKLDIIKRFTRDMAEFYSSTNVVVIDTFHGPRVKNIRELLLEYTETCNESSVFDVQKVLSLEYSSLFEHTCGMLGVPGNISSCTLLHGIHLCMLLESLIAGRCIGDDALVNLKRGLKLDRLSNFQDGVNNLGTVEASKFSMWRYDDDPEDASWHYTKAPLTRIDSGISQGIALVWPSIANLLKLDDRYHTTPIPTDLQQRKTFIAQWSRLLTRLYTLSISLSDVDRQTLRSFQNYSYRRLGFHKGGYYISKDDHRLVLPVKLEFHEFGLDWKPFTIDIMRGRGSVRLPLLWNIRERPSGLEMETFESQSTKLLSLLENLGYLEKEMLFEDVDFSQLDDALARVYIDLSYTFCYSWRCTKDFPRWVDDVSWLELMPPHERISSLNSIMTY